MGSTYDGRLLCAVFGAPVCRHTAFHRFPDDVTNALVCPWAARFLYGHHHARRLRGLSVGHRPKGGIERHYRHVGVSLLGSGLGPARTISGGSPHGRNQGHLQRSARLETLGQSDGQPARGGTRQVPMPEFAGPPGSISIHVPSLKKPPLPTDAEHRGHPAPADGLRTKLRADKTWWLVGGRPVARKSGQACRACRRRFWNFAGSL